MAKTHCALFLIKLEDGMADQSPFSTSIIHHLGLRVEDAEAGKRWLTTTLGFRVERELLPANPADIIKSMPNDTRLHREGGGNLLAAAKELGVRRCVVQSRGFYLNAPAGQLADETAKLRYDAPAEIGDSARAFSAYESRMLGSPTLFGTVLRYGFFYGPGTWYRPDGVVAEQVRKRESAIIGEGNAVWSFVHIDDAIAATVASLTAEPGIYNVVDDDPLPVAEWLPAFARWVDAPEPPRVSDETALETAGAEAVYYHRSLTGASNGRAKEKLGFAPRPLRWKS
jgi:2-alkyl-3-oxoalkanoate reductase